MALPIVAFLAYLPVPGEPLGFDGWRWVVMISAYGAIFLWFIPCRSEHIGDNRGKQCTLLVGNWRLRSLAHLAG
jgi:hypothetical protein